jgi:hypothetical protein
MEKKSDFAGFITATFVVKIDFTAKICFLLEVRVFDRDGIPAAAILVCCSDRSCCRLVPVLDRVLHPSWTPGLLMICVVLLLDSALSPLS